MKNRFQSLCVGAAKTARLYALAALFGLSAFGLIASQAQTQTDPSKADTTYSVQRVYKAGDVDRYKISLRLVSNGPQTDGKDFVMSVNMLMKETIKAITPEGTVTTVDEFEQANSDINNQHFDMTTLMPKVTQSRDKAGHTDVKTEGGNPQVTPQGVKMAQTTSGFQAVFLPAKPVKVGDTWTADGSSLAADPTAKAIFTVKLESVETLNGVTILHLKAVADITGGKIPDAKMRDEVTLLVDAKTGKSIKMLSKTDGTAGGGKITAEMTINSAEASDKPETTPKTDPGAKKDTGDKKP